MIPVILAFAMVESSLNPQALGDKNENGEYLAYGLFQFHEARWKELTKEKRIGASVKTQIIVFCKEYDVYQKRTKNPTLTGFANYHNRGHHSNISTKYTRSIHKWIKYFSNPNHKIIKNEELITNTYNQFKKGKKMRQEKS